MEWKGRLVNRLYRVTEATLEDSDNPGSVVKRTQSLERGAAGWNPT